jgi:hypothetical protein
MDAKVKSAGQHAVAARKIKPKYIHDKAVKVG